MTKVIKRRIKVSKFNFQLEIYPNLEGHKEISWEVFPETYKGSAALRDGRLLSQATCRL